jgi:pyruvate formate lyase activating enzyme
MRIGGFLKSSLIEYPGMVSAVIFTQGCNFRCPYCHNPELVEKERFGRPLPEAEILAFLEKRRGLLDAVVISGGEPTLQEDLSSFMQRIRNLGYLIKLDTNGTNPEIISELIRKGLVDYIAMDIKAPLEQYSEASGVSCDRDRLKASLAILSTAGIEVEFRTTVVENLHSEEDIIKISELIPAGRKFCLQKFCPNETLDTTYKEKKTLSELSFDWLQERFKGLSLNFAIR